MQFLHGYAESNRNIVDRIRRRILYSALDIHDCLAGNTDFIRKLSLGNLLAFPEYPNPLPKRFSKLF